MSRTLIEDEFKKKNNFSSIPDRIEDMSPMPVSPSQSKAENSKPSKDFVLKDEDFNPS